MSTLPVNLHTAPHVVLHQGHATTTSLEVAAFFSKQHYNVIRDIEKIEVSEGFKRLNFEAVDYIDKKNEARPMYRLTKDGFIFLVMGFTGKRAALLKESYITAFNQLEAQLRPSAPSAQLVSREHYDAVVEELLAARPDYAKLLQCEQAHLTRPEIGRVLGVGKDTIGLRKRRLRACGLLPAEHAAQQLPLDLGAMQ